MVKLKLRERNLGRVFNSRLGCAYLYRAIAYIAKWPNLKVKTKSKHLSGFLPLAFALPNGPISVMSPKVEKASTSTVAVAGIKKILC
jgi:hypothetical protein